MSDVFSFSSLWGEWYIKDLIGEGTFGEVYRAEKKEYGNTYISAVKHISIPSKDMSPDKLMEEGLVSNEHTISLFYENLRDQIINEINFCYALRGHTNIVSYEDHCIITKKNGLGYDIFIRMEYLTALTKYMRSHNMTENDVIQLGIDICSALEVLHARNMLHRDIKPANIFVSPMGVFELEDFGESKILSDASVGMTVRGTYAYMSPEISRGNSANITADIYSLGLVMYRLLNGNRAPFIPQDAVTINAQMQEESNTRRLRGEMLPVPSNCMNRELCSIIMKACEFLPQNRWQSPEEMKIALTKLKWASQEASTADSAEHVSFPAQAAGYSPPAPAPERKPSAETDNLTISASQSIGLHVSDNMSNEPMQKKSTSDLQTKPKSKKPIIISVAAAVLIIAIILTIIIISSNNIGKSDNFSTNSHNVDESYAVQPSEIEYYHTDISNTESSDSEIPVNESSSDNLVDIPNFVGKNIDDILDDKSLKFNFVIVDTNDNYYLLNIIVSQEPEAGTKNVKEDATIKLTVNTRKKKVEIPKVKNYSEQKALEKLEEKMFFNVEIKRIYSTIYPKGYVISISPEEGTMQYIDSSITLTVSDGPPPEESSHSNEE